MFNLRKLLASLADELTRAAPDIHKCNDILKEVWGLCNSDSAARSSAQDLIDGKVVQSLKYFYALTFPKFFGPSKQCKPPENYHRCIIIGSWIFGRNKRLDKDVVKTGLFRDVLRYLDEDLTECTVPEGARLRPTDSYQYAECMILILKNILTYHDFRNQYKECNAIKTLLNYRQKDDKHPLYARVESFLAQLADDDEVEELFKGDTFISPALIYLRKILGTPDKKLLLGLTQYNIASFAPGLNQLLLNKAKIDMIVDLGIIGIYSQVIKVSATISYTVFDLGIQEFISLELPYHCLLNCDFCQF